MYGKTIILAFSALLATAGTVHAASPTGKAWQRDTAQAALAGVDTDTTVDRLLNLTVAGDDSATLALLETTRSRPDWPDPARDDAVYRYVQGLRDLPAGALSTEVLDTLKAWTPNTLVPHEDHPQGLVPLFNIRAAAHGLENDWRRQEALVEGLALLRSHPRGLADAFVLESDVPVRAGYLQALGQADLVQLAGVNAETFRRLPGTPALTALAARAALLARDTGAMSRVVDHGRGPAVHRMLRDAAGQLDAESLALLFSDALLSPQRDMAALALAELYPPLAGVPEADAALLARLGDADLGAGAALALARSPALDTRLALEALAESTDRPAARRARLALQLQAEQGPGGEP